MPIPEPGSPLSHRELQVLWSRACGIPSTEIAQGMGVTVRTVKTHLHRSAVRLQSRNTAHSIALLYRQRRFPPRGAPDVDPQRTKRTDMPEPQKAALDAAYRERAELIAHLAALYPSLIARDPDNRGWRIVYVTLPEGQLSWHIAPGDLDLFEHVDAVEIPPNLIWDGHTAAQKYERLRAATARAGGSRG